jgi:medium-chain acyl-[acyl-carrier-protein] hydrolase
MGSVIAFETCREVRSLGLAQPLRLLVAGRPAPHLAIREMPAHDAPTEELLAELRELDGTPPEVLASSAALPVLLPTVRADLAMVETYRCRQEPPLSCPVSVFGGTDDRYASADELHAWQQHSTADCSVRIFRGGHFFLHEAHEQILSAISTDLAPLISRR